MPKPKGKIASQHVSTGTTTDNVQRWGLGTPTGKSTNRHHGIRESEDAMAVSLGIPCRPPEAEQHNPGFFDVNVFLGVAPTATHNELPTSTAPGSGDRRDRRRRLGETTWWTLFGPNPRVLHGTQSLADELRVGRGIAKTPIG